MGTSHRALHLLLAALLALAMAGAAQFIGLTGATNAPATVNRIVQENLRRGSTAWQSPELAAAVAAGPGSEANSAPSARSLPSSGNAIGRATGFVDAAISGYADQVSVNHGAPITLYVSTTAPTYSIDVYRMGWYGGNGANLVLAAGTFSGMIQPVPDPDPITGLIDAGWQPSYTLQTGGDWTSGVYLAKLTSSAGNVGYITFVLRDDNSTASIVYQVPVTTWEAYNNWGGKSLYDENSTGGRAYKVSFNRPYSYDGPGTGGFFDGDYNTIRFLERTGYNVTYATSVDLAANPHLLDGRKVFLSNWHDEYWSKEMRDNLTAASGRGVHLAFFDANNIYWQIRFEPSATGAPNRTITCYKDATLDTSAPTPGQTTVRWRDQPVNQPENGLLGAMYQGNWTDWSLAYPWIVQNSTAFVYRGTGLADGDQIPSLVGYEFDSVFANGQTPSGLVTLSASPVQAFGYPFTANAAIYKTAAGGYVFDAGTFYWAWKLDDNIYQSHGADARVQQMTQNLLNTMLGQPLPPPLPASQPGPTVTIFDDAPLSFWYAYSWGATYDLANANPVHSGTRSISFTANEGYAGLELVTNGTTSVASNAFLHFYARATQPGQALGVFVQHAGSDRPLIVPLANYGGNPASDGWTSYLIPLADLGVDPGMQPVWAVGFTDVTGGAQPAVYLDDIQFVPASGGPTTTATLTPQPNAEGWLSKPASITLSATAPLGFSVSVTYYTLDGGARQTYAAPGITVKTDGTHTLSYWSVDSSGASEKAHDLTFGVDQTAPTATIASPDGVSLLNQAVLADYRCSDSGAGLTSCVGPAANGAAIDTTTVGRASFKVVATDRAGNVGKQATTYQVTYNICPVGSAAPLATSQVTPKLGGGGQGGDKDGKGNKGGNGGKDGQQGAGSPITIALQLCDAGTQVVPGGANVKVTATDIDGQPKLLNAPGDGPGKPDFAYDPAQARYMFAQDPKKLASGAHTLNFTVTGDPVPHAISFTVP